MTTLRQARTEMFARSGIAPDGGYGDRWVRLDLGPVPLAIPNTQGRVDAVRFHDLHHVLTGYATDWSGEFEISAWEIASGCADKSFAWMINLQGMAAGSITWPRRTFRAFVRGLRSRNLYRERFDDALLAEGLHQVRQRLGLGDQGLHATSGERLRFALWLGIAWLTVLVPLGLLGALLWAWLG